MSLYGELKRRNVIRVAIAYLAGAWLLIQVVETLFPIYGLSDSAIRLVVTLVAIGLPVLLVVSWFFELTPEGFKLEKNMPRSISSGRRGGEKLDRFIIVVMVIALGYFTFDKFVLSVSREAALIETARRQGHDAAVADAYGDKSIVVLPFVNLSGQPDQEFFSDGISEELLNLLAKIPDLRVISRSSAFSFKGKDIVIPEVAKQLNVAHVLEGSVRKDGNRVRITAQLVEARTDSHLWSESYDRSITDIFAVQDEIAAAITNALKVELGLVAGGTAQRVNRELTDFDAYSAYLHGRNLIHLRGRENLENAVLELERVLRLNQNFAPGHAHLAIAITLLADDENSYGTLSLAEVIRRAEPHLDRAHELEPGLPETYAGRALLALKRNQLESTVEQARKALQINPSYVDALNWQQIALKAMGRYQEADAILNQILLVDPLTISGRFNYIDLLSKTGRIQEAHAMADLLLKRNAGFGHLAHADISLIYEGRIADGLSWALKAPPGNFYLIYAFLWVGEYAEARRIKDLDNYAVDLAEKRFDKVFADAMEKVRLNPDDLDSLFIAAEAMYEARRFADALPLFERFSRIAAEGGLVSQPLTDMRGLRLALVRRWAGDGPGAAEAIETVKRNLAARRAAGRNNQELYRIEAMVAAFENDTAALFSKLSAALQLGMRSPQAFDDPVFDGVRGDARFIAIQQKLDTILKTEHQQVLQLICFDNPVPDNWQPLPETCAGPGTDRGK
jgi:TolB-like protein/tetratricopeptide (TPR) repeat protein